MNREDRGVLVGMVLGDGYIRTASAADKLAGRRVAAQLTFAHSLAQRDYAQHKLDVLNKMFGGNATLTVKEDVKNPRCYTAKSNPYFKTLKGMMYHGGKLRVTEQVLNMLTPQGIAYWFMDDGSFRFNYSPKTGKVSSVLATLCSYHSREEIDLIIAHFEANYGIHFKPAFHGNSGLWSLRLNTGETKKFASLVREYMHPTMLYKLGDNASRHECPAPEFGCVSCGKKVRKLSGKKMCNACYLRQWYAAKKAMI